jgi:hypothetical protein
MAVTVTARPFEWNAIKNPTVYKLARIDYAISVLNNAGGFAQAQINSTDLTAYFQVGNTVILQSSTGLVSLKGSVTASAFSSPNTLITTDLLHADVIAAGVNDNITNLSKRTDYRIEVEVFQASDNKSLADGVVFSFTPDTTGLAYADMSAIVKAYLSPEWSEPAALNEIEEDTSLKVYIKYQEYYDGALVGAQTDDVANPRYAVFGALQIPSSVGNNLTAYVPADNTKKFLTIFERLKLWRGYPATLSFIFPDALVLYVSRKQYDQSGTLIGVEDIDALNTANDDAVNRLDLMSGFALDANAKTLKVKLVTESLGVYTDYTEELTFAVEDPCDNPVLLVWKNSLGGDAFWMFEHSQEVGYNLSGSKKAKRMTLFAEHLTLNQWEALNELNTLGEVSQENIVEFTSSVNKTAKRDGAQVYVVDASGNKTGVIVIPTTSVINTKDEVHSIEIEIEYPQRIE